MGCVHVFFSFIIFFFFSYLRGHSYSFYTFNFSHGFDCLPLDQNEAMKLVFVEVLAGMKMLSRITVCLLITSYLIKY